MGMEQYSLLILLGAMIAVWLFTWQPWRKRPGDGPSQESQAPQDRNDDASGDRRR